MKHAGSPEGDLHTIKVVLGVAPLATGRRGGVTVVIAELDGVHQGHRSLIRAAAAEARLTDSALVTISLEAGRRGVVRPERERGRLMSPAQQERMLASLGVQALHILALDDETPVGITEAFVREILVGALGAQQLIVGCDLGCGGSGVAALLRLAERHGISTTIVEASSSSRSGRGSYAAARKALMAGRPDIATGHLGHTFAIEGVVKEGQKLGRQLGFPTANISAGDYLHPALGVYATRTLLPDGRRVPGVANFGVNPTTGLVEARLEVHLFDFDEDLYGQVLETELVAFLRPELKFDGLDPLIDQIRNDAAAAKAILCTTIPPHGVRAACPCWSLPEAGYREPRRHFDGPAPSRVRRRLIADATGGGRRRKNRKDVLVQAVIRSQSVSPDRPGSPGKGALVGPEGLSNFWDFNRLVGIHAPKAPLNCMIF